MSLEPVPAITFDEYLSEMPEAGVLIEEWALGPEDAAKRLDVAIRAGNPEWKHYARASESGEMAPDCGMLRPLERCERIVLVSDLGFRLRRFLVPPAGLDCDDVVALASFVSAAGASAIEEDARRILSGNVWTMAIDAPRIGFAMPE